MNRVNIRIARIFNTYGPRMHPFDGRVVSNFILQALEGKPLTIFGDGSQTRSFCYRDDLIEGLIQEALDLDRDRRCLAQSDDSIKNLIAALSRKEREVLELIAVGKSVKAMAAQLQLSVRAIEQRRQGLMEKLRLHSPLELVQFSVTAQRVFRPAAAKAAVAAATPSDNGHDLSESGLLDRCELPRAASARAVRQDHPLNAFTGRAVNGDCEAFAAALSRGSNRPR